MKHKKYCYITVIIAYLIYSIIQTELDLKSNLYQILGTSPQVDDRFLKSSFRKLSLLFHPDKVQSEDAEQFVKIREAYEILKDPVKRLAYDHFGMEVFQCEGCRTYPDFLNHHIFSVGIFYAVSASTVLKLN
jgi:DnaJ-class molecular chaperone